MSSIFRNYTIPTITSNVLIKSAANDSTSSQEDINQAIKPGAGVNSIDSQTNSEHLIESAPLSYGNDKYQHPNRFIAPGKQGTELKPKKKAPKRRFSGTVGGSDFHKTPIIAGSDESYPKELNALIKPLFCELCNAQLNSPKTANIHYQSKTHDKNITAWLTRNYSIKGLEVPTVKRFYGGVTGPVGPDAYHCECCDLKLTSKLHAEQHYMGRKHALVLSKISNPSGSGYYTSEGKWVRTGTKATPVAVESNDGRFGIGEGFKQESETADLSNINEKDIQAVSTEINLANQEKTQIDPTEALTCKLCNINVTSSLHMAMHLEGTKHRKKLKASVEQSSDLNEVKTTDTLLASLNETDISPSDMSMYRTPSGCFYCKICNISIIQKTALVQHLQGKKHIKKSAANSKEQAVSN